VLLLLLLLLLPLLLLLLLLLSPWCRRSRMRSLRTLIACLSSSVMMGLEGRKGLPRARRDSNTALAASACSSVAWDRAVWTAMSAVRSFSRATARFIVAVSRRLPVCPDTCWAFSRAATRRTSEDTLPAGGREPVRGLLLLPPSRGGPGLRLRLRLLCRRRPPPR